MEYGVLYIYHKQHMHKLVIVEVGPFGCLLFLCRNLLSEQKTSQ